MAAYGQLRIGSPFEEGILCGPVHRASSLELFNQTIQTALQQNGQVLFGGEAGQVEGGNFCIPTIIEIDASAEVCQNEAFVPILYLHKVSVSQNDKCFFLLIAVVIR